MPIKKLLLWSIPVLFIAMVVGLIYLPAPWIVYKVQQQVPALSISQVNGSLLRGSAHNVEFIQRGYPLPLETIRWRLDWMSLVFFNPCFIFADQRQAQGHLCIHPISHAVVLHQVKGQLPVSDIAEIMGLAIEGNVQITLDGLTLKDQQLFWIRGDIVWQNAEFHNGEKWLSLGNLLIALDSEKESSHISAHWLDMADAQGFSPLDVDIDMRFSQGRLASIQGSLKPLHTTGSSLEDTLNLIATYQEGKTFFIER